MVGGGGGVAMVVVVVVVVVGLLLFGFPDSAGKESGIPVNLGEDRPQETELEDETQVGSDSDDHGDGKEDKPDNPQDDMKKSAPNERRTFQDKWLLDPAKKTWLRYDVKMKLMFCTICQEQHKKNTFTKGTNNFRTSTLTRHVESSDHQEALNEIALRHDFETSFSRSMSEKEQATLMQMKTIYWMVKEGIALNKFGSLRDLLSALDCPYAGKMKVGENAKYTSLVAVNDMVSAMASCIRQNVVEQLRSSPSISILADESTDLSVTKKLVLYAKVLSPSFVPSTHFLANLKITSATGRDIADVIKEYLDSNGIPMDKVSGFGTDGASVMTGKKEGATGYLMRLNPAILNIHCIAHRLALCSSQAANSVPYLKDYQEVIVGLFYHFKRSANRADGIKTIQQLLDEPQLKYSEVHEVRWLSFYKAYFAQQSDPRSKGYAKK